MFISQEDQRLDRIRERFFRHVDKTPDCWLWKSTLVKGYGHFMARRKRYRAHRFAYKLLVSNTIPEELAVEHTCHVKHCVNPQHLVLGPGGNKKKFTNKKGVSKK